MFTKAWWNVCISSHHSTPYSPIHFQGLSSRHFFHILHIYQHWMRLVCYMYRCSPAKNVPMAFQLPMAFCIPEAKTPISIVKNVRENTGGLRPNGIVSGGAEMCPWRIPQLGNIWKLWLLPSNMRVSKRAGQTHDGHAFAIQDCRNC